MIKNVFITSHHQLLVAHKNRQKLSDKCREFMLLTNILFRFELGENVLLLCLIFLPDSVAFVCIYIEANQNPNSNLDARDTESASTKFSSK